MVTKSTITNMLIFTALTFGLGFLILHLSSGSLGNPLDWPIHGGRRTVRQAEPDQSMKNHWKNLASGSNQFALDMYKKLSNKEDAENIFFSPFSITTALAMTLLGARGETASQMKEVMKLTDISDDVIQSTMESLLKWLKTSHGEAYTLQIANKIYVQEDFKILKEFLDATDKYYDSEAENVDFGSKGEQVRQEINTWIEEQTNHKIKELIKPGMLNAMVKFVIVNAIYFKGNWMFKFDESLTHKGPFTTKSNENIEVPMMFQKRHFKYGYDDALDVQILELPYVGQSLKMVILLPKENNKLTDLESKLDFSMIQTMSQKTRNVTVEVYLPRFKLTQDVDLSETLHNMGMADLFGDKADLSGIDGKTDLFVSKVLHQAYIEVNEEGSEAAAATAVIGMMKMAARDERFVANRPFMFYIQDTDSDMVLFMGRLAKPSTES